MTTSHSLAEQLATAIPAARIATDDDSLQRYGRDWTRYTEPCASAVVFPTSTEEVAALVKLAASEKIALVPSGGRTGLSGGACATQGEVVVSFDRMNRIRDFNPIDRTVTVEAGLITEALQNFATEQGLYFPVDFASRGSSQVGGNVATNAGGIKVLRWGMFRDWVAGIECVTGTGEVLQLNQGLVKNNTGYDLRHLFVGSEGTLGLITAVTLRLTQPPAPLAVMVLAVPELSDIMTVFASVRAALPLTAFEFFSEAAMGHVLARGHVRRPFDGSAPYYVIFEYEHAHNEDEAALTVFEQLLEQGVVADGVLAQSDSQARDLWRLREDISESITPRTPYKNDIAVKVSQVPAFVAELDALLAEQYPDFEVVWFGHIGDGNLHINILRPEEWEIDRFRVACERVNELVFALLARFNGSMSAEHGVGLLKRDYLHISRSEAEIALMRGIKAVFDPQGILNPGKVLGQ